MDADFWHQRWEQQQIAFHQQLVNPLLSGHWPALDLPPGAPVLVPLCGKSLDMLWLLDQGHPLVGVELSAKALEAFFEENSLQPSTCQQGPLEGWRVDDLTLLCGDFFALTLDSEGGSEGGVEQGFAAIYDRAALIALPPSMRDAYIDKLVSVLRPDGQILLITLEYPPEEHQGPPFSISEAEVQARFSERFSIEKLDSERLTRESSGFSRRGLLGSQETVFRLKRI
ncbi:MAG: thiopurine S-methyltransferase [Motiliproteus sp.]|jgi:thiopurine S-methyltransferase